MTVCSEWSKIIFMNMPIEMCTWRELEHGLAYAHKYAEEAIIVGIRQEMDRRTSRWWPVRIESYDTYDEVEVRPVWHRGQ